MRVSKIINPEQEDMSGEVREMEIKEMPLQEKYERLLREEQATWVACYAFHKEHGTMEEWLDYYAKVQKKMLPLSSGLGKAFFGLMKTVTPGRALHQVVKEIAYDQQKWLPSANIELKWASDSQATMTIKNCPLRKINDEAAKKAGLDIDSKFVCEKDTTIFPRITKDFGVDMTHEITEDGCRITLKLA